MLSLKPLNRSRFHHSLVNAARAEITECSHLDSYTLRLTYRKNVMCFANNSIDYSQMHHTYCTLLDWSLLTLSNNSLILCEFLWHFFLDYFRLGSVDWSTGSICGNWWDHERWQNCTQAIASLCECVMIHQRKGLWPHMILCHWHQKEKQSGPRWFV